ncbi:MAG: metal ABC transporter permease [Verrucomicrobia bacterium]|nr:metal ABC transporter permease [Verrucomicrobiota bacterium]
MDTLKDILSPDFLLRNSLYVSLLVGFACPLVGVFLVLRRLIFLGVALPQISSTGIAFALSMHVWYGHGDGGHGEEQTTLAFVGAIAFTVLAILWLALLEKRGRGLVEGRLGTAYVVATAISLLLLAKCPVAERGWLNLLKGEIIAISQGDLRLTGIAFAVVLAMLWLFHREFMLVSFDRDMALTLRRNVVLWDLLLFGLIGLTVAVAVLSVGPLIAFAFLLVPPLVARQWARNMRQFVLGASVVGGLSACVGFALAYRWDLPVGPTDVALLGSVYALTAGARRLVLAKSPTLPFRP